ncbi:MAG TPA: DUF4159 domain-containing protein [Humisphaera sp.]|nr:DUF4159 domain-containing protein [Humisphaera sp.]
MDAAIAKAIKFVYSQQKPNNTWEEVTTPEPNGDEGKADVNGRQWGGLTSMATYALLAANESPQDKRLAGAISFLKTADVRGIYALGLRCQVWLRLRNDKTLRQLILHDRDILLHAMYQDPKLRNDSRYGFYSYYFERGPRPDFWYDHSVSQYGVLGMWALEQAGGEVPIAYWKIVDGAWRRAQLGDGGWSYRQSGEAFGRRYSSASASMTAAGVATLFITQDYIQGDLAACRGNITNENIEHGLVWMDRHIKQELAGDDYYTLYGIERIGVASGRKFFDGINWYESGAKSILAQQKENGSWNDNIPDTCFAMLFLVRGRAPVVMNKLEYDLLDPKGNTVEGNWNQRPRDVANFTRWMGQQLERDLNWQAVNLNVSVDDLQDAPILYISGNQELRFKDEQMKKLRTYIDRGGMILANPDCASRTFTASFERLGKQLFPQASYKFRELEASHPILNDQMFHITRGHPRVRLRSMSNGVREIMMIAPDGDIGRFWQMQADRTHADAYEAGANIFLYAIDKKGLRYKGESLLVREDSAIKPQATVSVGRLEAGADPDPEPGGWPRLAAIMHNDNRVALDIKRIQPIAGELNQVQIVHLTGTSSFQFTADQRAAIVAYINRGGTLIIDAAGGSLSFAESAEEQLRLMFGDAAKDALARPLPPDHPLYRMTGATIDHIYYRAYTKATLGNLKTPRVKGITVNGRLAVFYSREDLSAGLVGEPIDGIFGYEPETAEQIMRNLILYAAGVKLQPATLPATLPAPQSQPATLPTTQPRD